MTSNMFFRYAGLFAVAAAAAVSSAGDFIFVRGGRPVCVMEPSGNAQVDADAAFFSDALARIAGAPPDAKHETRVVFRVEKRGLLEEDDWSFDFPDARTMRITGTDMSCRWALNEILEKDAGVVFCFYGPDGTHWPHRADFSIRAEPRKGGPKGLRIVRDMYVEEPQWERCLGGKKQQGRFFHHAICTIFPLEKYAKEPFLSELMPERDGKRVAPAGKHTGWQVCWTSDLAVEEAVSNICRDLEEHPERKVYSLSVNDLEGYCQCARCRAANGGTFETPCRYMKGFKSHSRSYYRWVNRVAAGVAKRHPGVFAGLLAYCGVIDPPPFRLHPNVVPFICADSHSMVDPPTAARRKELFAAWNECASHFGVWDYTYGCDIYVVPRVYTREMSDYYGIKRTCPGFDAAFLEGHSYRGEGPKRWLFGKLMYDPTIDVASALDTWYDACVGKRAAVHLKAYYAVWEDFWRQESMRTVPWYRPDSVYFPLGGEPTYLHVLDQASVARADELMRLVTAEAERTGDPAQRSRAKSLATWHEFRSLRLRAEGAFNLQRPDGTFADAGSAAAFLRKFPEISAAQTEYFRYVGLLADAKLAVPYKTAMYGGSKHAANGFRRTVTPRFNLVKAMSEILGWLDDPAVDAALKDVAGRDGLSPDLAAFARGLANRGTLPDLLAVASFSDDAELAAWRESRQSRRADSPQVTLFGRAADGSRRLRLESRGGWPAAARIVRGVEHGHNYLCSVVVSNAATRAVNVRFLVCTVSMPSGSQMDSGTSKSVPVLPGESRKVSIVYRGGATKAAQMYVILNGIGNGGVCAVSGLEMKDMSRCAVTFPLRAAGPSPSTVVCHRGDRSAGAKDNSYEALSRAAARGFSFECDIRLDEAGRVYCAHDAGKPAERPAYFGEVLPLAKNGRWIVVDVKVEKSSYEPFAKAIKRDLDAQKTAGPGNLFFICHDRKMLRTIRRVLPEYKAMWLTGCSLRGDFPKEAMTTDEMIGYLSEANASGVDLSDSPQVFTKEYIARLAAAGYEVHMCTQGRRADVEDAFSRGALTVTPLVRACEIVEECRKR